MRSLRHSNFYGCSDPGDVGYRESNPSHPSLADYLHCLLTVHISVFLHQSIAESTDCPFFLKDGSAVLIAPYPEGFFPLFRHLRKHLSNLFPVKLAVIPSWSGSSRMSVATPPAGSPRTDKLIDASIQWAERILKRIDNVFGKAES